VLSPGLAFSAVLGLRFLDFCEPAAWRAAFFSAAYWAEALARPSGTSNINKCNISFVYDAMRLEALGALGLRWCIVLSMEEAAGGGLVDFPRSAPPATHTK